MHWQTGGPPVPLLPGVVACLRPQRHWFVKETAFPASSFSIRDVQPRWNTAFGYCSQAANPLAYGTTPQSIRASIPWEALTASKKPYAIALRVAPFGGPFAGDDTPLRTIAETAKSLLAAAATHGVKVNEFQLDFDCAQKKLDGYRIWLKALRPVVSPLPLVITTLPAWLDEPEFAALLGGVDGYVLQVHSVPTAQESGRAVLCDPALADAEYLGWIAYNIADYKQNSVFDLKNATGSSKFNLNAAVKRAQHFFICSSLASWVLLS